MTIDSSKAYSGFAVSDLEAAQNFYEQTLGLKTTTMIEGILMQLDLDSGRPTLVYQKDDHEPANYTILNFPVGDLEASVDELAESGVEFERYDDFNQDEKGIARPAEPGQGPDIAWFTDPSGNIFSVHADV